MAQGRYRRKITFIHILFLFFFSLIGFGGNIMPFLGCSQCWPIPSLHSTIGCPLRKQTSTERAKGGYFGLQLKRVVGHGWESHSRKFTGAHKVCQPLSPTEPSVFFCRWVLDPVNHIWLPWVKDWDWNLVCVYYSILLEDHLYQGLRDTKIFA